MAMAKSLYMDRPDIIMSFSSELKRTSEAFCASVLALASLLRQAMGVKTPKMTVAANNTSVIVSIMLGGVTTSRNESITMRLDLTVEHAD